STALRIGMRSPCRCWKSSGMEVTRIKISFAVPKRFCSLSPEKIILD
ncbi:hypothetical protein A2U01_0066969, partial [Trifolium medium]|nr:hypothetical protein [Trifolium medium]